MCPAKSLDFLDSSSQIASNRVLLAKEIQANLTGFWESYCFTDLKKEKTLFFYKKNKRRWMLLLFLPI